MRRITPLLLLAALAAAMAGCGSGQSSSDQPVTTNASGVKGSASPSSVEAKE